MMIDQFTVLIERDPESGWLAGSVKELPGCYTQAPGLAELETNIREAIQAYLATTDDPRFPLVTYRRGANGQPTPVVRGTNIRVQTIVVASRHWQLSSAQIGAEYDLSPTQVREALAFYQAHRPELDASIDAEKLLESAHGQTTTAS